MVGGGGWNRGRESETGESELLAAMQSVDVKKVLLFQFTLFEILYCSIAVY